MAGFRRSSGFLLGLLINLLLDFAWSIPAWICLVLHFWIRLSIWWFVIALSLWILGNVLRMEFLGWAARCSNQQEPSKENKNPYSAKSTNFHKK